MVLEMGEALCPISTAAPPGDLNLLASVICPHHYTDLRFCVLPHIIGDLQSLPPPPHRCSVVWLSREGRIVVSEQPGLGGEGINRVLQQNKA